MNLINMTWFKSYVLYLAFLYKFLYYSILIICVILLHFALSWMLQQLLSYMWLNLPAHQICVLLGSFYKKNIPFYLPNLCDSNTHGFIMKGGVFIDLFTVYYVSKVIKIDCFGNLGFKKIGVSKNNKIYFRGGVYHKQRETWRILPETGFLIRTIL